MNTARYDPLKLMAGVLKGERRALARAITLVESTRPEHRQLAIELLETCLLYTSPSPRDVEESRMPSSA